MAYGFRYSLQTALLWFHLVLRLDIQGRMVKFSIAQTFLDYGVDRIGMISLFRQSFLSFAFLNDIYFRGWKKPIPTLIHWNNRSKPSSLLRRKQLSVMNCLLHILLIINLSFELYQFYLRAHLQRSLPFLQARIHIYLGILESRHVGWSFKVVQEVYLSFVLYGFYVEFELSRFAVFLTDSSGQELLGWPLLKFSIQ